MMFTAAPAAAQTVPVSYPPSRALSDVGAWLQRETPIAPGQVVDVSPSAVTAVTGVQPTGQPRGFLANISSEALDPQILSHEAIASWSIPVEVDCDKRTVRLGVMTGFASRDLRSDPKTVRAADSNWVAPTATAPLGAVIRALCDRNFRRPLEGKVKLTSTGGKAPETATPPSAPEPKAARAAPALRPALPAPGTAVVDAAPAAKPAAAKAAPAKASAGGGAIAVQIGASPSQADIQTLLTKAKAKFAADMRGLKAAVATVQIDGKTVNRALISGFGTNAEANAFCKKLVAEGQACFIRR
jgi:cell division septation protein DedD